LTGPSKGNGKQGKNAGDDRDRRRLIVEIAEGEMLRCNRTTDPV
jgi:hypothetical protein